MMIELLVNLGVLVVVFGAGVLTGANSPKTVDRTVDAAIARLKGAQIKAEATIQKITDHKAS